MTGHRSAPALTRDPSERLALALLLLGAAIYGLHALLAVATGRHLYGDAAWFLVRVASEGRATSFVDDFATQFFYSRALAFWTTQGPAVLLIRLGVRNLQTLSYVFGAALFGCKLISLVLCYRLLQRGEKLFFVFPALGLFAGTINSDVYIVSETHLSTSLAWPILIALHGSRRGGLGTLVCGVFIAASALIHESFAFFAALMLALLAYRWWKGGHRRDGSELALMVLLSAVMLVNLAGIVFPRDPVNRGAFSAGLLNLVRSTFHGLAGIHVGPVVSVLVTVAVLAVAAGPAVPNRTVRRLLVSGVCLVAAIYPLAHFVRFLDRLVLENAIDDRGFSGVAIQLALMVAFLAVHAYRREAFSRRASAASLLLASLIFGQVAWQLLATRFWKDAVSDARSRLASAEGVLSCPSPPGTASAGRIRAERELCKWWITPLSIVLSPGARVHSLIVSRQRVFQAFDAADPNALPGLRHVDHDYGPYVVALGSARRLGTGQEVHFAEGLRGVTMLREGFALPEDWGTWTDGDRARLEVCGLAPPPRNGMRLLFHVTPFVPPGGTPSDVDVVVGERHERWRFAPGDRIAAREALLPAEAIPSSGCVDLWFFVERPRSPSGLGLSQDPRRLGLALVDLQRQDLD